jgi:cell filamentation protein
MYDSIDDPYCYPGTNVLKNRRNLRTQAALDRFETAITAQRFNEPMPAGKLTERHYRRVHRHIFRDVYTWTGEYRGKVRISKGDSTFCYPEHIPRQMAKLFEGCDALTVCKGYLLMSLRAGRRPSWPRSTPFMPFVMEMAEANLHS